MRIDAYLSLAPKGIHAHLLDIPGCFTRGRTQDEALAALAGAIRAYLLDLQRHGENVDIPDKIEIHIAETDDQSTGPFDPGDTAALFEIEKRPISSTEMERYFQLAAYNRADLMALVKGMYPDTLDWKPDEHSFTIRRILRHIGNADEWYVSRIVPPGTLPPEWENDENLPIFEFLQMERRTAIARLRQMSEVERSDRVVIPAHFTSNSTEPWTARKALRRMLEHEREHTAHIREVLAQWRARHLAQPGR
ncbi:MAG TPA: DinB family protein [Anaerolineales bacterium]|nr:DinB family protein [Anaerolineales bacterium]